MPLQQARHNVVFFPDRSACACGFFINPRSIITAAHVLKNYRVDERVHFRFQGEHYSAILRKKCPDPYLAFTAPDVALLETDVPIGPVSEYTLELPQKNEGFTVRIARPDGLIDEYQLEQDGMRYGASPSIPDLIGLSRNTGIIGGWSGAPVFRSGTSQIIGYMIITRDGGNIVTGSGGYFVPLARILNDLPTLNLKHTYETSDLPTDPENTLALLYYKSRLAPYTGSINGDLETLTDWALQDDAGLKIRLIYGPGGSGKSRLAYELIQRVEQQGTPTHIFSPQMPILTTHALIVADDIEEQGEELRSYLKILPKDVPLRLLLLSRRPAQNVIEDLEIEDGGDSLDHNAVSIPSLTNTEVIKLYNACSTAFAARYSCTIPEISEEELLQWISQDPLLYRLPLFVQAIFLEVALSGRQALYLSTEYLIQSLVKRECRRLSDASLGAGLPKHALTKLSAFAAIKPNLSWEMIKSFQAPELEVFSGVFGRDRLKGLSWFSANVWTAPTPDILAAAIVYSVFTENEHVAPLWLWSLLKDADTEQAERLARLVYDIGKIFENGKLVFNSWLQELLHQDPARASALSTFKWTASSTLGAFGASICRLSLQNDALSTDSRFHCLISLSERLQESGDLLGAIAALEESIATRQTLSPPDIGGWSLGWTFQKIANLHRESGNYPEALAAIQQSIDHELHAASRNSVTFEPDPDLIRGLQEQTECLIQIEDYPRALIAAEQALFISLTIQKKHRIGEAKRSIYLQIFSFALHENGIFSEAKEASENALKILKKYAINFFPELGLIWTRCLSNDSTKIRPGHSVLLEVMEQAIAVWLYLAEEQSEQWEPELTDSLKKIAIDFTESAEDPDMLLKLRKSIEDFPPSVLDDSASIAIDLAITYMYIANCRIYCEDHVGALSAAQASVDTLRDLPKANPDSTEEVALGWNLITLSNCLRLNGNHVAALTAIQESVDIFRRAAESNSIHFESILAHSLDQLSIRLCDSGEYHHAIKVIHESIKIYSTLARAQQGTFEAELIELSERLESLTDYLADPLSGQ